MNGWGDRPERSLATGLEIAQRAVVMDEDDPQVHFALAVALLWNCELDKALAEARRCLALAPGSAEGHLTIARIQIFRGDPADAIEMASEYMRLDPLYRAQTLHFLAEAQIALGRYEEAVALLRQRLDREPHSETSYALLASCYGHLGKIDESRAAWEEVLRALSGFFDRTAATRSAVQGSGNVRAPTGGGAAHGRPCCLGRTSALRQNPTSNSYSSSAAGRCPLEYGPGLHDQVAGAHRYKAGLCRGPVRPDAGTTWISRPAGSSRRHHAGAQRRRAERVARERRAHVGQHSAMLRRRGAQQRVFIGLSVLEAVGREHPADEPVRARPSRGVDLEARETGVAEEARDRDVGDRKRPEEEPVRQAPAPRDSRAPAGRLPRGSSRRGRGRDPAPARAAGSSTGRRGAR